MGRYARIYRVFFVTSFQRELEFRANFFAKVLQNVVWLGFFVVIVSVIYQHTDTLGGWNQGAAFVLAATCFTLDAVVAVFFRSLMEIPEQVRKGTLDFVVTKPVDSQFWVSLRRFHFDQVGAAIAGVVMLGYGVATSGAAPGAAAWLAYTALFLSALVIFYSFCLALMTLGVWFVRVDNLWVVAETVVQVARYPLDIYSGFLQRMFVFYLPLGFLATVPARQLAFGVDGNMVALGAVWSLVFFVASRALWRFAMRSYTSASS